jgi:hypothetical protein
VIPNNLSYFDTAGLMNQKHGGQALVTTSCGELQIWRAGLDEERSGILASWTSLG